MLQLKICKHFNVNITTHTIGNYMCIIGYTKKKITRRLYNKSLKEQLLNRKKMKKLIKTINKDDIICIDESGINRELYSMYGWCQKK